jgi:hypothetical protein
VSNIPEIKGHVDRLTQLGNSMRDLFAWLKGPGGEAMKKKAKGAGTRVGIGAGISFFGVMVATLAMIYSMAVIILLFNLALHRLWLSALIVVLGSLIIGGVTVAVGARLAKSSAKELTTTTEDVAKLIKQIGEEMKAEVEEIQGLLKKEAEERQKKMAEMVKAAKKAAPVAGPLAIGACVGGWLLKKAMKSHRENRAIRRVIESYEEAKAEGESS